jgi:Ca2+/Na+ antiporter
MLETSLVSLPFLPEAVGNTILLLGSFGLLLLGAKVFTNGVEWLGHRLGVSESATGSILAAVGTALPETMIPVLAIVQGVISGDRTAANEVGVGAILGAPFMLATIAMFLIGVSVLYFARRRTYGGEFHFNARSTRRDLSFFLVGYTLAFAAALVESRTVALAIGALLVVLYVAYLYRSLRAGELMGETELDDLHLGGVVDRVTVDDTNPNVLYVAFMALAGSPANADILVARSSDGGFTWEAPVTVNDDATGKHQFWPAIDVSNGALHVAWYDFRNSPSPGDPAADNDNLHVFYASSNTTGVAYPTFSHNVQVTDVGHDPNCLMFGGGTVGFHGDYIELDARFDGTDHIVHLAWADNRDVSPCDLDPEPGPPSDNTGNRNQNIYADTLIVAP